MKKLFLYIFALALSTHSFAFKQYKRLKTSNFDLRSATLILSIESTKGESHHLYKSVGDEYFIDLKKKDKSERRRISNTKALDYDKFFVSQFIHLKYSLPNFKGKSCSKSFTLSMRGELQNICKSEKDKLVVMNKVIKRIEEIYIK